MPVWREEYSYGIKVLITVVAVILIMLSAKTMGFHVVKLPGGFDLEGAPSQVSKNPEATDVSAQKQYKAERLLRNASGVDWVEAKCPEPNERAVSGLCVINSEDGWGWLLQNAGVTGDQTWGCAYRRAVYVEGGLPEDGGSDHEKFALQKLPWPYDVKGAAVTAKATATVLCVSHR